MTNRDKEFKKRLDVLLSRRPTPNDVEETCRLLEEWEKAPGDGNEVKQAAVQAVQTLSAHEHLKGNENMLRIYTLVGRYSKSLGFTGVMDQLEKQANYTTSYKFHLLWAQSHAQKNHAQKFREIREMTLRRIVSVTPVDIKEDFKLIAEQYLQGQTIDGDHFTPAISNKLRRQSAVAFIQRNALQGLPTKPSNPTSRIAMRLEFVDRAGYSPISPEEWIAAQYTDQKAAEDDDMDISAAVAEHEDNDMDLEKTVASDAPAFVPPPRTPHHVSGSTKAGCKPGALMSTLAEVDEADSTNGAKRPRVFSPLRPVSESRYSASKSSSPVSFTENEYKKADAVFCDTVNYGANPTHTDITLPVVQAAPDAFEVYEDPAEHSVRPKEEEKSVPAKERKPLSQLVDKPMAFLDMSAIDFDRSPINGVEEKKRDGVCIVTSTPFVGPAVVTENEFFGDEKEKLEETEDSEENFPNLGFAKRRSMMKPVVPQQFETKPLRDETLSNAMANIHMDDLERTGVEEARPVSNMEGMKNPWDKGVRDAVMAMYAVPQHRHDFETTAPRLGRNKDILLGGEKYVVEELIGEGGFAKVFKCVGEEDVVALKYEVPNCAWEMYVCDQMKKRLLNSGRAAATKSIMEVTDGYIFSNASILLNEYHPHGTLLDVSNKLRGSCTSQLLLFLGIQIASVLKEVHACGMIHGDVKPDNIVVLSSVDENGTADELLSKSVVKFIDWGRAIDIRSMSMKEFKGRGGTANFDCPEMLTNKPWNFQTDFFGFIVSLQVMGIGRYGSLILGARNKMDQSLKRRLACRDVVEALTDRILNIPSCEELPSWDDIIQPMTACFHENFSQAEWRTSARTFNEAMKK